MKRNSRLDRVQFLRAYLEDKAANRFAQSRKVEAGKRQLLDDLHRYRDEYERQLLARHKTGITAPELENFRRFMETLEKALAEQQTALGHSQRAALNDRRAWEGSHQATEVVARLADRRRADLALVSQRRDERQREELVIRNSKK